MFKIRNSVAGRPDLFDKHDLNVCAVAVHRVVGPHFSSIVLLRVLMPALTFASLYCMSS